MKITTMLYIERQIRNVDFYCRLDFLLLSFKQRKKMVATANTEWVADVVTMTCKNTTNNIVVIFEKLGINLTGKIKNLPLELINKWTVEKNGEVNIRNAVKEAEEIFLKAYKKDIYEEVVNG